MSTDTPDPAPPEPGAIVGDAQDQSAEWQALCEAATPCDKCYQTGYCCSECRRARIALEDAAPDALPALLADRRQREAERDRLREALTWAVGFIRCHHPKADEQYPDFRNADDLVAMRPVRSGEFHLACIRAELLEAERDKLQAFKNWCHQYLDGKGVPHHPPGTHGAEGCRIGDRMDWAWAERDRLAAELADVLALMDVGDAAAREAAARVAELEAENARLRSLLEPFARYVDRRGEAMPDDTTMDPHVKSPTLGDCRRAADALHDHLKGGG